MSNLYKNIQDTLIQQDTAKVIKATKIVPATLIKSEEGAIIPKEAVVPYIKLQPSIPAPKKEEDSMLATYLFIGLAIIGLIILVRKFYKKA